MEVDEYREKVDCLKELTEAYRMIALGEEPDSEESEDNAVDEDY